MGWGSCSSPRALLGWEALLRARAETGLHLSCGTSPEPCCSPGVSSCCPFLLVVSQLGPPSQPRVGPLEEAWAHLFLPSSPGGGSHPSTASKMLQVTSSCLHQGKESKMLMAWSGGEDQELVCEGRKSDLLIRNRKAEPCQQISKSQGKT